MKVKCISITYSGSYEAHDFSNYITVGKLYDLAPEPPCSPCVYNIIDDRGKPHDIGKECFETLREINLSRLLD